MSDSAYGFVAPDGSLRLNPRYSAEAGLEPGAEFEVSRTSSGLVVRRRDPLLSRVYVEPSSLCNLSCRTCVRNSWDEPLGSLDIAVYRKLVADLAGVPSLHAMSFWGFGEPLLHPNIIEMLRLAKGLGVKVEMITNGLLLTREVVSELLERELDTLVISVDGTTLDGYADIREGADLAAVQANVDVLRDLKRQAGLVRPEIGLEFVVMKRNLGELANLHTLARRMGASFIIVTNVLPYTEEMRDEILYNLWAASSYRPTRSEWNPEIILPLMDARREVLEPLVEAWRYGDVVGDPIGGRLREGRGYCRFVNEGAAVVGWDGQVSPCIALMHSYPCYALRKPKHIRRYTLGSVASESIADIWRKDEYVAFRERVKRFDFSPCTDCGGCDMGEGNEEDCLGNPFPVCGDCLWAKGVIQCP